MSVHDYLHTGLRMTLRNGLKSGKVNLYLKEIISLIYTLFNLLNKLGELLLAYFSSGFSHFCRSVLAIFGTSLDIKNMHACS